MLSISKFADVRYKDGGREYPTFDCFGLVLYLYKEFFNIDLPDFIYDSADNKENEELYYNSLINGEYEEITPQEGAIVALRVNGYISHVGFMINNKEFIHIMDRSGVRINKITAPRWKNRVIGFYKYA